MKSDLLILKFSGFGGLDVAYWPLVPKFASTHPTKAFGILGRKNFYTHGSVPQINMKSDLLILKFSGFGGLDVAYWPLVPKFAGTHPTKAFGILG